MAGPRGCHPERSRSVRAGEISCDSHYVRNLKTNDTNKLAYRIETDSQTENEVRAARGKTGEGRVRESEKLMHTLLYLE